jgi:Polyketide synthase dehydratase
LPGAVAEDAGLFGVHPALLDAVLHALGLAGGGQDGQDAAAVGLPFAWSGVSLHASGAGVVRARLVAAGPGAVSVVVADEAGQPVVSVESLVLRPMSAGPVAGEGPVDGLFGVEWVPVAGVGDEGVVQGAGWAVLGAGDFGLADALAGVGAVVARCPDVAALPEPVPGVVVACVPGGGGADGAVGVVGGVLGLVQGWLAGDRFAGSRLVVVTRGGVVAGDG